MNASGVRTSRLRFRVVGAATSIVLALLAGIARADQPPNEIASYGDVRGLAASYNLDDKYSVVLVATSTNELHELFYQSQPNAVPSAHGDSIIGSFDQPVVGVAGFYAQDDNNRIAIVATAAGDIHEVFYHPSRGRGQSVIGHFEGIVSIAAFYNEDDKYRVVLVATRDGNLYEVFYHPTKGKGQGLLATYPGIKTLAGYFDPQSKYRTALAVSNDGTLHILQYHPTKPRIERAQTYIVGNTTDTAISISSSPTFTVMATTQQTLRRCSHNFSNSQLSLSCFASDQIATLTLVALGSSSAGPNTNLVYATRDGVIHKYIAPTPIPPAPAVNIVTFQASPSDYIKVGESTTLVWNIANCLTACSVGIEARHGLNYADLAWKKTGLPTNSSLKVTPSQTNTRYTLTASNPSGSAQKRVDVALYQAPGVCTTCGWYFFKVQGQPPSSFCSTIAMFGQDATSAKTLVEQQNQGYSVTSITEQQYYDGCT